MDVLKRFLTRLYQALRRIYDSRSGMSVVAFRTAPSIGGLSSLKRQALLSYHGTRTRCRKPHYRTWYMEQ